MLTLVRPGKGGPGIMDVLNCRYPDFDFIIGAEYDVESEAAMQRPGLPKQQIHAQESEASGNPIDHASEYRADGLESNTLFVEGCAIAPVDAG